MGYLRKRSFLDRFTSGELLSVGFVAGCLFTAGAALVWGMFL